MASISENRKHWGVEYGWPAAGEEWSHVWGGSGSQWDGSLLPRIRRFLPAGTGLEIACGFGRWSQRLRPWCRRLILIDLVEPCVAACKELFQSDPDVDVRLTDGLTLPGVADGVLDFVFSMDSLVHAESEVIEGYARELARCLSPDGVGFLHHSNFAALLAVRPGAENRHWRAEDVSSESVVRVCRPLGLSVVRQEIVDWGGVEACDAFSTIVREGSRWDSAPIRLENPYFMGEAQSLAIRRKLYENGELPWRVDPEIGVKSAGNMRGLPESLTTGGGPESPGEEK